MLIFINNPLVLLYYRWDWDTEKVTCPRSNTIQTTETIIQAVNTAIFFQDGSLSYWSSNLLSWLLEILACFLCIIDKWITIFWEIHFFLLPLLRRASVGKVTDRSMRRDLYMSFICPLHRGQLHPRWGGEMRKAGDNVHGLLREKLMVPSPLYFLQTPVLVVGSEGWYGNWSGPQRSWSRQEQGRTTQPDHFRSLKPQS